MAPEPADALLVARAGYGAVLAFAPPGMLSALARRPVDTAARRVARVLGIRELVQAAVLRAHPDRDWQLGGATVDLLHAASMVALAVVVPRRRALALRNARTAGLLAASCVIQAWRAD